MNRPPRVQLSGESVPRGGGHRRLITRLALRDIVRHKARSLLVVLLVALPVALVSGVGTADWQANQGVEANLLVQFGDADFIVEPLGSWDGSCRQVSLSKPSCESGRGAETPSVLAARQRSALEHLSLPGAELYPQRSATAGIAWRGVSVRAHVTGIDATAMRSTAVVVPDSPLPGPDEVWLSADGAERYGWKVGDTIDVDGHPYRVTGLTRTDGGGIADIWTAPTSRLAKDGTLTLYGRGQVPTAAQVKRLNAQGLGVMTRDATATVLEQTEDTTAFSLTVLLGVLAAMVTATVAGAAFAIGARQQRRMLALLGVTGACRSDLSGVLWRQGWLLGLLGSVVGVVVGNGLGNALTALGNATSTTYPVPHAVNVDYSLAAFVIGLGSSVVASWFPARAVSRQDALVGVRRAESPCAPARRPWWAMVLLVSGVAGTVVSVAHYRSLHPLGGLDGSEDLFLPLTACLVCLYVGVLGSLGWLLDKIARPGRRRLSIRLALRDLARNRARAVACVAAVFAVTTLTSALTTVAAGTDSNIVAGHQIAYDTHVGVLSGDPFSQVRSTPQVEARRVDVVRSVLGPQVRAAQATTVTDSPASRQPGESGGGADATGSGQDPATAADVYTVSAVYPPTAEPDGTYSTLAPVVAPTDELVAVLTGRKVDPAMRAALARGAVVLDPALIRNGSVELDLGLARQGQPMTVRVPASAPVTVVGNAMPVLVDPALLAQKVPSLRIGSQTTAPQTYLRWPVPPDAEQARAIDDGLTAVTGEPNQLNREAGPDRAMATVCRWVALVGSVVLLAVGSLVVALTLSDSRASRAVLASVGAAPSTLRGMASVHALVTALLGAALGLVVGAVPIALAMWGAGMTGHPVIPWGWLALPVLAAPLVLTVGVRVLVPAARPAVRRRT